MVKFDMVKKEINKDYDLPNNKLDLITNLLVENDGNISKKKYRLFKDYLSVEELEHIIEGVKTVIEKLKN